MTNRHWIDLQVLYDSVLDPKKCCVYCNMSGKNVLVGRDFLLSLFSEMHILSVIMLHQHKVCVYTGKRKLKLLIACENMVYFCAFTVFILLCKYCFRKC